MTMRKIKLIVIGLIFGQILFYSCGGSSKETLDDLEPAQKEEFIKLKGQAEALGEVESWDMALEKYKAAYAIYEDSAVFANIIVIEGQLNTTTSSKSKPSTAKKQTSTKTKSSTSGSSSSNSSSSSTSSSTSSASTVAWLGARINAFERSKYTNYGGVSNANRFTDTFKYELISSTDCSIKFIRNKKHVTEQNSTKNDYTENATIEFNFTDIKSVTYLNSYSDKGYEIKTKNDANKISVTKNNYTNLTNKVMIHADELGDLIGQPEQFVVQFKSVINACEGNKKEIF